MKRLTVVQDSTDHAPLALDPNLTDCDKGNGPDAMDGATDQESAIDDK